MAGLPGDAPLAGGESGRVCWTGTEPSGCIGG